MTMKYSISIKATKEMIKATEATNYCNKHSLYHGQKYKACTPEKRSVIRVESPTEEKECDHEIVGLHGIVKCIKCYKEFSEIVKEAPQQIENGCFEECCVQRREFGFSNITPPQQTHKIGEHGAAGFLTGTGRICVECHQPIVEETENGEEWEERFNRTFFTTDVDVTGKFKSFIAQELAQARQEAFRDGYAEGHEEGLACSTDKTYYILANLVRALQEG